MPLSQSSVSARSAGRYQLIHQRLFQFRPRILPPEEHDYPHHQQHQNQRTLTPLQRSMRRALHRRLLSSPRLLLVIGSACYLLATIVVYCVHSLSYSHYWNSYYSAASSSLNYDNKHMRDSKKRSYAVFEWNEESVKDGESDGDVDADDRGEGPQNFYSSSISWRNNQVVHEARHSARLHNDNNNNNNMATPDENPSFSSSMSLPLSVSASASSSSSSSSSFQLQNPSFYGWTPEIYPNPLVDPVRCSIAYLSVSAALNAGGEFDYYNKYNDDNPNNNNDSNNNNNNTDTPQEEQPPTDPPVRLCDPDWVLGTEYLEEIAMSLTNFSKVFGKPDWQSRFMNTRIMSKPRKYLYDRTRTSYQDFSSSSSSSQVSFSTPPSPPPPNYVPATVQMAVAAVRKMNLPAVLREGSYYAYEDEEDMVNDAAQMFARSLHDLWYFEPIRASGSGGGGAAASLDNKPSTMNTIDKSSSAATTLTAAITAASDTAVSTVTAPQPPPSNSYEYHHNGIIIFLSIQDRVCFISTGSELSAILPWWRLDHIVGAMKPDLQHREYGTAVLRAIENVARMLEAGPPTLRDRLGDFVSRFGVVIAFALFTFCFGAWGEYRDRRKRWQYAEQRSKLSDVERDKARQLQKDYRTRSCPICLEPYEYNSHSNNNNNDSLSSLLSATELSRECSEHETTEATVPPSSTNARASEEDRLLTGKKPESFLNPTPKLKRVDTFGIPLKGADGKPIKLLRCGHVFCESCWKSWVHSGYGNPCNCPVCRQDVGRAPRKRGTAGSNTSSSSTRNNCSRSSGRSGNRHHAAAASTTATSGDDQEVPPEESTDPESANQNQLVQDDHNSLGEEEEDGTRQEQEELEEQRRSSVESTLQIRGSLTHPSYDAVSRTRRLSPPSVVDTSSPPSLFSSLVSSVVTESTRCSSSSSSSSGSGSSSRTGCARTENSNNHDIRNNHSESTPLLGGNNTLVTANHASTTAEAARTADSSWLV